MTCFEGTIVLQRIPFDKYCKTLFQQYLASDFTPASPTAVQLKSFATQDLQLCKLKYIMKP